MPDSKRSLLGCDPIRPKEYVALPNLGHQPRAESGVVSGEEPTALGSVAARAHAQAGRTALPWLFGGPSRVATTRGSLRAPVAPQVTGGLERNLPGKYGPVRGWTDLPFGETYVRRLPRVAVYLRFRHLCSPSSSLNSRATSSGARMPGASCQISDHCECRSPSP